MPPGLPSKDGIGVVCTGTGVNTASLWARSVNEEREGGGGGDEVEVPDTFSIPSPEADSDDSVLLVS